jgi:hypothetical protein
MAEPSTTVIAISAAGITLSSLLLGIDGNAVVGAFAGALLMVLSSKDLRWPTRVAYLFISWVMGYLCAPELTEHLPIDQTGVAAFLAAATVVTITLQLIERAKHLDLLGWLRRNGGT